MRRSLLPALLALAIVAVAACSDPSPSADPTPTPVGDPAAAVIEAMSVVYTPGGATLIVSGTRPSPCHEVQSIVGAAGTRVTVALLVVPIDGVTCAQVESPYETRIALPGAPGAYVVEVNDEPPITVEIGGTPTPEPSPTASPAPTATAPPSPTVTPTPTSTSTPTPTGTPAGTPTPTVVDGATPVVLAPGEAIATRDGRTTVTFLRVVEDSRCPVDVVCIWAGRATVLFRVDAAGEPARDVALAVVPAVGAAPVGDMALAVRALLPRPRSTATIAPGDYRVEVSLTPVAPAGGTGVAGIVTLGPVCPVAREDQPCPDDPYEATLTVVDASGGEVARTRSGADGRYAVALPPGTYTLVPEVPAGTPFPVAAPVDIVVPASGWAIQPIAYDTGIR